MTQPEVTQGLRILPEESALEDRDLGELPHPDPVAPWPLPVPIARTLDPLIPTAGSAPETQALQVSGPDIVGRVQGWTLTRQQLRALLLKRFLLAYRSRRGLFSQVKGDGH